MEEKTASDSDVAAAEDLEADDECKVSPLYPHYTCLIGHDIG